MAERRLLVLDSAYSRRVILERGLVHSVTARDLDGYFAHVWSVNPLLGADPADQPHGPLEWTSLAERHTVVEAHVTRFGWRRLRALDFLIAQLQLVVALHRLIRRERISVIRIGEPYYQGLLGLGLARLNRIPLVIRINGNHDAIYDAIGEPAYPRLFRYRWVEKRIDRFVLPRADLVAGANQNNLDYALANGARPERSTVFRYGNLIDPVHLGDPSLRPSLRGRLGLGDAPFLVCVGRLERVKHADDVIEVLARVRAAHPGVRAVFVGDGSQREPLLELARSLDLEDAVVFAGNLPQTDVAAVLSDAAVVLAPMTGRALVEAALSDTPIVAYDVEWHGELLIDGVSGRLVPYRDVAAMADAASALLDDPDQASALSAGGRRAALDLMAPGDLSDHEREQYDRVLDRSAGAR